jgi:hypothetical protein
MFPDKHMNNNPLLCHLLCASISEANEAILVDHFSRMDMITILPAHHYYIFKSKKVPLSLTTRPFFDTTHKEAKAKNYIVTITYHAESMKDFASLAPAIINTMAKNSSPFSIAYPCEFHANGFLCQTSYSTVSPDETVPSVLLITIPGHHLSPVSAIHQIRRSNSFYNIPILNSFYHTGFDFNHRTHFSNNWQKSFSHTDRMLHIDKIHEYPPFVLCPFVIEFLIGTKDTVVPKMYTSKPSPSTSKPSALTSSLSAIPFEGISHPIAPTLPIESSDPTNLLDEVSVRDRESSIAAAFDALQEDFFSLEDKVSKRLRELDSLDEIVDYKVRSILGDMGLYDILSLLPPPVLQTKNEFYIK